MTTHASVPPPPTPPPTPPPPRRRASLWRRLLLVGVVVVGVLLVLTGLDHAFDRTVSATHALDASDATDLVVRTSAGRVQVTATDRDDVEVVSHARSGLFSDADVDVQRDGDQLVLLGDCDGLHVGSCSVSFDVEVPRGLAADLVLDTTAGEIDLTGLSGDVTVRATAGSVRLHDYSGPSATVSTTAGEIEVDAGASTDDLDLRATAGSIHVRIDDREPLDVDVATTVGNQSVEVREAPDAERHVRARTTAGEIQVVGR